MQTVLEGRKVLITSIDAITSAAFNMCVATALAYAYYEINGELNVSHSDQTILVLNFFKGMMYKPLVALCSIYSVSVAIG